MRGGATMVDELPVMARQPLHCFLLLDCSGSMASDGKIQALNAAVREALPHLREVESANPHAQLVVRAIAFSTDARWHLAEPTPVEQLDWRPVTAGGYTDLGAAIDLLLPELETPPMPPNALPPAIVLVSDGMPTDDYEHSLEALLHSEWGAQSLRAAIAIGKDADRAALAAFMDGAAPLSASDPEQLAGALRWATSRATQLASTLSEWVDRAHAPRAVDGDVEEAVW
ncbi:vWA domain-containing protein [Ruicaihuangia caeni]|uniref:vWA domain-containing protein n=1 Tax=Ruicaihuangia caeni TaxID=3042517 RepID=UPI00338DC2FB